MPPEPAGDDGSWDCSTWIGIDGYSPSGSSDVLQAGIAQRVYQNGTPPLCTAFWEWWVPGANDTEYPYIHQQPISFPVKPGDEIFCNVSYVLNNTAGQVYLANFTTGQYFSHIAPPPHGASFNASCVEWIVEAPNKGVPYTSLPAFTPVNFTQAFGWAAGDKAVGDPQNGDYLEVLVPDTIEPLTSVSLGSLTVTIEFGG
jgi:hypothetical protein